MCPSVNAMMFQYSLNSSAIIVSKCIDEPEQVHVQNVEEQVHAHNCHDSTTQPQTSVLT